MGYNQTPTMDEVHREKQQEAGGPTEIGGF